MERFTYYNALHLGLFCQYEFLFFCKLLIIGADVSIHTYLGSLRMKLVLKLCNAHVVSWFCQGFRISHIRDEVKYVLECCSCRRIGPGFRAENVSGYLLNPLQLN